MDDEYETVSTGAGAPTSPKSPARRRRPALSCTICRRRKLKCDRTLPCGQCRKSKTPDACVYTGSQRIQANGIGRIDSAPSDPLQLSDGRTSPARGGLYVFDSKHQASANRVTKPKSRGDELQELRSRVQLLESALTRSGTVHTPDSSGYEASPTPGFTLGSDPQFISNDVKFLPDKASFRGKNGRTRFCGRSYYGTSVAFVSCSPVSFDSSLICHSSVT